MSLSKSTNVRPNTRRWLNAGLGVLAAVDAKSTAALVAELFVRAPPRRESSDPERATFRAAERTELAFEGERMPVFRFGSGPAVLLLHGWGGSSAQLQPFVAPLLARGASVVTFDAPGHGEATGRWLAIPRYARAIARVAQHAGPLQAVIGHSMGGAAAAFAVARGLPVESAVLIGPPASEYEFFRSWIASLGLGERILPLAAARVEQRVGVTFEGLRARPLAGALPVPLLVIHDREDREVPYADGAAIAAAAPLGRLLTTHGLGHRRILRDPGVIQASADFALNPGLRMFPQLERKQSRAGVIRITGGPPPLG